LLEVLYKVVVTTNEIMIKIIENIIPTIECKICIPDHHYTFVYTSITYFPSLLIQVNIQKNNYISGISKTVTHNPTMFRKAFTGHMHLNFFLENEYDTYQISKITNRSSSIPI